MTDQKNANDAAGAKPKTTPVSVRLPKITVDELDRLEIDTGMTRTQIVIMAIAEFAKQQK